MRNKARVSNENPGFAVENIGSRLRDIRNQRKITVNDLAKMAGVSAGMISQIERNISSPSIRILERIRQALNVPLMELVDTSDHGADLSHTFIRRAHERPVMISKDGSVRKELLSPSGDHDIQFMYISLLPGVVQDDVLRGIGEKAGVVLSGSIVLKIAGNKINLQEGDSFQFSSELPHAVQNDSDQSARLIWIMNTQVNKPVL